MALAEHRLAPIQAWQDHQGGLHATEEAALRKNNEIVAYDRRLRVWNQLQRWGMSHYGDQFVTNLVRDWPGFRDMMEAYYEAYERLRR